MNLSETNPNGVWTQIVAATPRPEVEELAKIIGKRLINTNEDLWHELCALKEIVADFLTFEFGNMKLLNSTECTPEKMDSRNKPSKSNSRRHTESLYSATEDFMSVAKDSLTVSKIHEVINVVQEAFAKERVELEAEIALMQTTMDTESEVISRGNTPRRDKLSDSFGFNNSSTCDNLVVPSPTAGSSNKVFSHEVSRKLSESASASVHKSVVIIGPGRIRRSDSSTADKRFGSKVCSNNPGNEGRQQSFTRESSDLTHSLNMKLDELSVKSQSASSLPKADVPAVCSQTGPSPSSSRNNSGGGSTRNRVRSRIETARDERFFMDEDIFMK